jgi:hypothetical protein
VLVSAPYALHLASSPSGADPEGRETPVPFTLATVAVAVVASLLRGGRFRHLADRPLVASWLLFAGVAVQVAVNLAAGRGLLPDAGLAGWTLLLLSQLLVVAFLLANRRLPGVWLVATGLLLNAAVIAANRAMPVDPAAIAALGLEGVEVPPGKHTLLTDTTRLPWLADIIPVPWLRSILSVGDLVIAVGLVPLTHGLLRPPRGLALQAPQAVMLGALRPPPDRADRGGLEPVAGLPRRRRTDRPRPSVRRSPQPGRAGRSRGSRRR